MRISFPRSVAFGLLVSIAAAGASGSALAQSNQKPAAKPASKPAQAAQVPPDVRAKVVSKIPGASPGNVAFSPIPGLYEVTMGGLVAYVTADGKYLVSGNVYDLDSQTNLTEARRNVARAKALSSAREDQMIVFSPANPKMTVNVFTDIDCGYCRKFHSHIAEMNKAGIRVRYLMFPRTGPGTESWKKAEAVWCAADRKDALTRAKRGEEVKSKDCGDAVVKSQYELGDELGVQGTPAVFAESGDYLGGYMDTADLVARIKQTQVASATP